MCSKPVRATAAFRRTAIRPRARTARGLSLVEVMIGLVVGLLVSLAAANSAMMFTAMQRQGIGASGTAVNAGAVMSSLRDDLGVAGMGFFGDSSYLCNRLNLSYGGTVHFNGTSFSPVQVVREAGGDRLDVIWGSRIEAGADARVREGTAGASVALNSYLPVRASEAVLLAPSPPSNTTPCLVRTVTGVTASTEVAPQQLAFANTELHNQASFATNPGFDDQARVTLLGAVNWVRYRVVGGDLVLERPLTGATAVVARNVISFRVQYGVSAAGAGNAALESWVDPTGDFATLDQTSFPRVRAVRVGLIVRSPQLQKRNASGQCDATETRPALWGAAPEAVLLAGDWNCYRYRTSTVVVPLQNVVLGLR